MRRAHDRKVAVVQGRERRHVQPFRDGDDRRVDETEPERLVGLDERCGAFPVRGGGVNNGQLAGGISWARCCDRGRTALRDGAHVTHLVIELTWRVTNEPARASPRPCPTQPTVGPLGDDSMMKNRGSRSADVVLSVAAFPGASVTGPWPVHSYRPQGCATTLCALSLTRVRR